MKETIVGKPIEGNPLDHERGIEKLEAVHEGAPYDDEFEGPAMNLAMRLENHLDAVGRYANLALDQVGEDSLAREYLLKVKTGARESKRTIQEILQCFRDRSVPKNGIPGKMFIHGNSGI